VGWRKVIVVSIVVIGACILCGLDKISGEWCVGIMTAAMGAFTAGNAAEHKFKNKGG